MKKVTRGVKSVFRKKMDAVEQSMKELFRRGVNGVRISIQVDDMFRDATHSPEATTMTAGKVADVVKV